MCILNNTNECLTCWLISYTILLLFRQRSIKKLSKIVLHNMTVKLFCIVARMLQLLIRARQLSIAHKYSSIHANRLGLLNAVYWIHLPLIKHPDAYFTHPVLDSIPFIRVRIEYPRECRLSRSFSTESKEVPLHKALYNFHGIESEFIWHIFLSISKACPLENPKIARNFKITSDDNLYLTVI